MTDVTPTAAATVTAEKKKRTHSPLNQRYLREMSLAESVIHAALEPVHATALGKREIGAEFVAGLQTQVDAARVKANEVLQHSTAAQTATAAEVAAAKLLLAALREAQTAAKQRYARTNRIALRDYFVGRPLNGTRHNLQQTSQTILAKAADDDLPGFTAAKIRSATTLRTNWISALSAQAEETTAARSARGEFRAMLKSIADGRVQIQLAADAEWPHTDEAHAGIRREFGLSARRPFKA
jgi:hypothetical protein